MQIMASRGTHATPASAAGGVPAAEEDAGVVSLLKLLRARIYGGSRGGLRCVLPCYARVLGHHHERETIDVHHQLLQIRGRLLACADVDVLNSVQRLDQVVERCLAIGDASEQEQDHACSFPMQEALRLLVALAGGGDGETFVLEDPTRVAMETASNVERERIGDRMRMDNAGLVQRSRALFEKPSVPLEEQRLLSPAVFQAFGSGIPRQRANLWCPGSPAPQPEVDLSLSSLFGQTNRFMSLRPDDDFSVAFGSGKNAPQQFDELMPETRTIDPEPPQSETWLPQAHSAKEVFFYDGTHTVRCRTEQRQSSDWGNTSSALTESSSWDSESFSDLSEPWTLQPYAWEDLGDRAGLSRNYCRPSVRESQASLQNLVIPAEIACKTDSNEPPLEVHEADLVEDALRALGGIESTIFHRDLESASFRLPERRELKLRGATVGVTTSVLEVFRKAGTLVLRLELLAIYYSQDPTRGGKTLQAMGNALLIYLSIHRERMEDIAHEYGEPPADGADSEDGIVSIAKLVVKTQKGCRALETVARVLGCDGDIFWPLLQHGDLPRGVAFIDHLHQNVSSLRVEDATGSMEELVTWFLIQSCAPLLAALSDFISSGRVDETTDPFDEFDLTIWSRKLLEKAATGGGDGLFSESLSADELVAKMLPTFLQKTALTVTHVGQVQALLRSMDAVSSNHPLVNLEPLVLLSQADDAVKFTEEWHSTMVKAVSKAEKTQKRQDSQAPLKEKEKADSKGEIRPDGEEGWLLHQRTLVNEKRSNQRKQRDMLDEQVSEKRQREIELIEETAVGDKAREAQVAQAQTELEEYGREVLLNKYSELMAGAEERHDYMKWRRDRALRFSAAKDQLRHLYEDDTAQWATEREQRKEAPHVALSSEGRLSSPRLTSLCLDEAFDAAEKSGGGAMDDSSVTEYLAPAGAGLPTDSTAGVPSSPADSSGWRASVKVNAEAGNRDGGIFDAPSPADADPSRPRTTVRVSSGHGGSRMEASASEWRASVKVNVEAGKRNAGIFDVSSPADASANVPRATVRVSSEPGGSGADMYASLYGSPHQMIDSQFEKDAEGSLKETNIPEEADVDMIDAEDSAVEHATPRGDADVPMEPATREEECDAVNGDGVTAGVLGALAADGRHGNSPLQSARVCLPTATHPFFSRSISKEDAGVVLRAMAETGTCSESLTPFALIVRCCVVEPVRFVADSLEHVALRWFRDSLQLVEHLRWLRKLMLMSEGLCMDIFARDFLGGLHSGTRVNWGVSGRLSSAFTLAMIEGSVAVDAIAQSFYYNATDGLSEVLGSRTLAPAVPKLLSEMELVYDVPWPLGLVITSHSLSLYTELHRFLLFIRLTTLEVRETWAMLRTISRRGCLSPELQRLCGEVDFKMQAFLGAFNETFTTTVLMASWVELEHALQRAVTLVELRRCHEEYVAHAACCCFLDQPTDEIHSAVTELLVATWSFTGFIRALELQGTRRLAGETRLRTLCNEHDAALRTLVDKLQSASSNRPRNVRDFAECLLLRLDFNGYYSSETPAEAAMPVD